MAALCAACGAKKSHSVHLKALSLPGSHPYLDASRAGLKPVSEGRQAYQQSAAHREAYAVAAAEGGACLAGLAGAPGACFGTMTPHHVLAVSAAGSLEVAERYPVIPLCLYHNDAIEGDHRMRVWARSHTFVRDGVDYPFRMTAADVRGDQTA